MVVRDPVAEALALQAASTEQASWSFLRSPLAPVIASVLGAIYARDRRSITGIELIDELDSLLLEMREAGFELPKATAEYVNEWVRAGYLHRHSPRDSVDEYYQLSPASYRAMNYLSEVQNPSRTATRSRLKTVIDQLENLASDTDADEARVLAGIDDQIAALERRKEIIRDRGVDVISEAEARERAENILQLTSEIPGDFARVLTETEDLDHRLREQILLKEISAGDVLENIFRGVDLIQNSEAGRSFRGFYELLFDRETSAMLQTTMDVILERPFVAALLPDQRSQLRWLIRNLEDHASDIYIAVNGLSRSLRKFVQSRDAESQQALATAIAGAQAKARKLSNKLDWDTSVEVEIELTTREFSSVGVWVLDDPTDYRIEGGMEVAQPREADLLELFQRVRESEIDWGDLEASLKLVLLDHPRASIAEIFALRPPTQGLASVVGIFKLALQYAERGEGTEEVTWTTSYGNKKLARLPRYEFTEAPDFGISSLSFDRLVPWKGTTVKKEHM
ncbi:MAG: DUF3375 domain-containing protein [Corynebacterium sp.]|nr:DUF3375 domain-containing protein [Corynebacterium sp.]